jgi:NNMT/PNMT/TEMT family
MHTTPDTTPADSSEQVLTRPAGRAVACNADFPWDEFDPAHYWAHNYTTLRDDDREILELVSRWFTRTAGSHRLSGLDIGAGSNLYPALAMLPHCASLTLREFSAANVGWLRAATLALPADWLPFWQVVSPGNRRGDFRSASAALAGRARVEQGSVFDLPTAAWDLGTMFFVAESISQDPAEFTAAVAAFVRAVKPGGPFAAAFMERSDGYSVGHRRFPATSIGQAEVYSALEPVADQVAVYPVETRPAPLRAGYTGMLVATGLAR